MNMNEMKVTARNMTIDAIMEALNALDAVQFGDGSFAVLQTVDGQEIWTAIEVKSKAWKATARSEAFDPFVVADEWKEDKAIKAKEKEEKAKEKAAKIAKDKAKREAEGAE